MLRILALLILGSCSMGIVSTGGEKRYVYDVQKELNSESLRELSNQIITSSYRGPQIGKLEELFSKNQRPLKRVGIIIFESEVQPTRDGLSGRNLIYLSESGKQIMAENFLRIWEQSIKLISPGLDYVPTSQFKKAPSFDQYGMNEDDFIHSSRTSLGPDDIFYVESGKKITMKTVVNPRSLRDMSFLLIPAYELMGGPKWSEHNKQFLNDVSKDLKLDALLIVMSQVSWTAAHTDKHSGEYYPEQLQIKLKSSVLVPLHSYNERLAKIGNKATPDITLCYKSYESELKVPISISQEGQLKNFDTIEKELLTPVFKTYKDLSQMMLIRVTEDLQKTW